MHLREHSTASSVAAPPSDGVVSAHLRCVTCQYDLFASRHDGSCPECGTPVATTLSAPDWRKSVDGRRRARRFALTQLAATALLALVVLAGFWTLSSIPFFRTRTGVVGVMECATLTACVILTALCWSVLPGRASSVLGARMSKRWAWWRAAEIGSAVGLLGLVAWAWAIVADVNRWIDIDPPDEWGRVLFLLLFAMPFFLLGGLSWRHLFTCEANALLLDDAARPVLRRASLVVGWLRFCFEAQWLGVCLGLAILLSILDDAMGQRSLEGIVDALVFGAQIGSFGAIGLWVLLIVYQLALVVVLRR